MLRAIKTNPEALGRQLGEFLTQQLPQVSGFNVKGFLNISFSDAFLSIHSSRCTDNRTTVGLSRVGVHF